MSAKNLYKYSGSAETPEDIFNGNFPSSEIIINDDSRKYISEGHFGVVQQLESTLLSDNDKELILVEKKAKRKFSKAEIYRQLRIHYLLKNAGIRTFTTFRTDGEQFYSTPLNKNGIVAISHKYATLHEYHGKGPIKLDKECHINNLDATLDTIIEYAKKASAIGLLLEPDCTFFLVDTNQLNSKQSAINLSLGVYDFDIVTECTVRKGNLGINNIAALKDHLIKFIREYVPIEGKKKYIDTVKKKLSPEIDDVEIRTANGGIKKYSDRTESDGEILDEKRLILDSKEEEYTLEEVQHLCSIPGLTLDLTRCNNKIKNSIKHIAGTIIDKSQYPSYEQLEVISGDALFRGAFSAEGFKKLTTIGGSADFSTLDSSEGLENLRVIGGCADFYSLESSDGLEKLESIMYYANFSMLKSAIGFKNLKSIGGDGVFRNLENPKGLEQLLSIGGSAYFDSLLSTDGIKNLKTIGNDALFVKLRDAKNLNAEIFGGLWIGFNLDSSSINDKVQVNGKICLITGQEFSSIEDLKKKYPKFKNT